MAKTHKILIVDDDKMVVKLLKEVFKEEYIIETTDSGVEALNVITHFVPDIILLDIMMPGMDGYEVCRRIRANKSLSCIKILLLSAKDMLDDRLVGYEAGANDYITKPFDTEELRAKVNVFLQLKYADELNRLKDDLLTLQSHETKTPLNSILGFAELLKKSDNLNKEEKQFAQFIIESGKELLSNTKKTLLLCQLTKGYKPQFIGASLENVVAECIQTLDNELKAKALQVKVNCNDNEDIRLDLQMIDTAIKNVLENAIQFSPSQGTITVNINPGDQETILEIRDQGVGIQQKQLSDIFNAFAEDDIWSHTKGLGISLAISKSIAEFHGGTITASNLTKGGASFKLTISRLITRDEE